MASDATKDELVPEKEKTPVEMSELKDKASEEKGTQDATKTVVSTLSGVGFGGGASTIALSVLANTQTIIRQNPRIIKGFGKHRVTKSVSRVKTQRLINEICKLCIHLL